MKDIDVEVEFEGVLDVDKMKTKVHRFRVSSVSKAGTIILPTT